MSRKFATILICEFAANFIPLLHQLTICESAANFLVFGFGLTGKRNLRISG